MATCTDIDSIVVDAVDESTREVFKMMAGVEMASASPRRLASGPTNQATAGPDISVVLGLSGGLQGTVSLTMSETAACDWTQRLLSIDVSEVDQTVVDAVGELGNIVVGGAKRRLSEFKLTMSLPSIIRAGVEQMSFPSGHTPLTLDYTFGDNPLFVLVSLSKQ